MVLLGVAFFLSGAAALVYQVVWQRILTLHTGIGVVSVSLIVAAFMAGITWYSWIRAVQQLENGDTSQTIGIPSGWYWGPLLIGGALSVVAALLQAWGHLGAASTGRGDAAPPLS